MLQKSSKRFLISIFFTSGQGGHPPSLSQARIQGGGKGALALSPFSGEKNKGAKNHTHRKKMIKIGQPRSKIQAKTRGPKTTHTEKKRSKSDNHEARYRLKRTPKHTKYAKIFEKNVLWGGGGGLFVHKSNIKVILLIVSLLSSNIWKRLDL